MKRHIRELLLHRDFDGLRDLADRKRRMLGTLVSLTFDPEPLIGWRAVEGMGVVASHIAKDDIDCIIDHLRKLHWLLSEESGGICWRSPEAIAEIVAQQPELFSDYGRIVVHLLKDMAEEDLRHFRAGILWAIGRLGPIINADFDAVSEEVVAALEHQTPQVRGMAAWCLGRTGRAALINGRPGLMTDAEAVQLYEDGTLHELTVGDLVHKALKGD